MMARNLLCLLLATMLLLTMSVPGGAEHAGDTAHYVLGGHLFPAEGLALPGFCHHPNEGDSTGVLNCMLQCPPEPETCTITVEDDHWGAIGAYSRCTDGAEAGYSGTGSRTIANVCDEGHVWVWPDAGATTGVITTS